MKDENSGVEEAPAAAAGERAANLGHADEDGGQHLVLGTVCKVQA